MTRKATNEEIIAAYERTGSVWRAAQRLGMAGQSVHERLRALNYPIANRKWSGEEDAHLRLLIGNGYTAGQAAQQLGRTFAAVTCRLNELGVPRYKARQTKIPRGAGYDKASMNRHLRALEDAPDAGVTAYCRANALAVGSFVHAAQSHYPERWQAICARQDLPKKTCPTCQAEFHPNSGKQTYCTNLCAGRARADRTYFGGKRNTAIGMAEGVCQLCGRQGHKKLTPHHVLGKENDPDNEVMVALCSGCHQLVTLLGGRAFVDDSAAWETLISLAWLRRHGGDDHDSKALYTYVEIELGEDEAEDVA